MKKLFGIIAILLLFSFAVSHEATAQTHWEVTVNWTDDCDDCSQVTGHEYEVCLKLYNVCTQEELFYDCEDHISSGTSSSVFVVTNACNANEVEDCIQVSARVIKKCVASPHEELCRNTKTELTSCEEIYNNYDIIVLLP